MTSHSPSYNLKAVLKETGLKPDVLRAWERRYELPKPQRTSGGHRLYSEYDIETVKWLRARQEEGLSISRAAELWKEIVEAGLDPIVKYSYAGSSQAAVRSPAGETQIETLRKKWLKASLAFESSQADEVLNQAFAIYPIETVCTEILQRGISDIGHYWYLGKASAQQEHFASAMVNRRLEMLIAATPPPTRRQTVLIGCPPGERHILSILLLNLFLSRRGIKVVYLGADIPLEQMEETARLIKPDLIVLAAQQLSTAAALQSATQALQVLDIPLAYGGLVFNLIPGLRERIPATFLGETLDGAVNLIEQLVFSPVPSPKINQVGEPFHPLARFYQEKRPLIEFAVLEKLHEEGLLTEYLSEANFYFGNSLSAALELGDPAFVKADLEWVKRLLTGRHIQAEKLIPYLTAYSHAIHDEMGEKGNPITQWMDNYLAENEIFHQQDHDDA